VEHTACGYNNWA